LTKLAAVSAVLAQATAAIAADMPRTLPPPGVYSPPERAVFIDSRYGWYLRGDLGYAWGRVGDAEVGPVPFQAESDIGNNLLVGYGAGYKSRWLRTDLTVDYLAPMNYDGSVFAAGDVSAKVSALSFLFNGYLDLGTWYGATPYIGAGAGIAQVRVDDYTSLVVPTVSDGYRSQWNFAWAVMAGLGYAISPNMMMDVGYRYISYGDVTTSDAAGAATLKDLAAHEVRVGVRWSFDDLMAVR
jgi:opacity protein-like surface antigen